MSWLKSETKAARAKATHIIQPRKRFADFRITHDSRISVIWYEGEAGANFETIHNHTKTIGKHNFEKVVKDSVTLLEEDDIKEGDWLLLWPVNAKGLLPKEKKHQPKWMRAHHVIPGGAEPDEDKIYTKLAIERNDLGGELKSKVVYGGNLGRG